MAFDLFFHVTKETLHGKSLGRILLNRAIRDHVQAEGRVLDLASGGMPSYYRFLCWNSSGFIRTDLKRKAGVDVLLDFNRPLPFKDASMDAVLLFSAVNILKDPPHGFKEIRRVLKKGARCYLASPFVFNESREPDDFARYTSQKLREMLDSAGFKDIRIIPIGERFSAAFNLLASALPFAFLRLPFHWAGPLLDAFVPAKLKTQYPCPIAYLVVADK